MMISSERALPRRLTGLWVLLRPVATLSWTGGAFILSLGLASRGSLPPVPWARLLRVLAIAVVIQGWLSHSLNDRTDWQTGTDRGAREFFSGGSGVMRLGYFDSRELSLVAVLSLLLVGALAAARGVPWTLWLYLAVGLWGAIAYSCRPWRLSYQPLAGEWLAAFPAITVCGLATYEALVGDLAFVAVAGSVLHGLLCVCWLMQHHLPDWWRDLHATPPKRTTIASLAAHLGLQRARLLVVVYFLLTFALAVGLSLISSRFVWTAMLALSGAALAWRQDVFNQRQVAARELQMVAISLLNAVLVGWVA